MLKQMPRHSFCYSIFWSEVKSVSLPKGDRFHHLHHLSSLTFATTFVMMTWSHINCVCVCVLFHFGILCVLKCWQPENECSKLHPAHLLNWLCYKIPFSSMTMSILTCMDSPCSRLLEPQTMTKHKMTEQPSMGTGWICRMERELCYCRDVYLCFVGSRSSSISSSNLSKVWLQSLEKFLTFSSGMPKGDTWLWNTLFLFQMCSSTLVIVHVDDRSQPWWLRWNFTPLSFLYTLITGKGSTCNQKFVSVVIFFPLLLAASHWGHLSRSSVKDLMIHTFNFA